MHVVEVELAVTEEQHRKLQAIGEHLRQIRNTVLGQLYKKYQQMIRTKRYKKISKQYRQVCESLEKTTDLKKLKTLEKKKGDLKKSFEQLREEFEITFEFARKYGEFLREQVFPLPDSVTVWSVCEMVWQSIEDLLFHGAKQPYFYKPSDGVTFQGKQENRCIILKYQQPKPSSERSYSIHFMGLAFPLIIQKEDRFILETLSHITYYHEHGKELDDQNIRRYQLNRSLLSTYRIRNHRIIRKCIRGRIRYFVQMVLEGIPVVKRKKDGSFRHTYGVGQIGVDLGTQSIAIVHPEVVQLKNLAERSERALEKERKIILGQRALDRSRRAMNPANFEKDGTVKKGRKKWQFSKRYRKIQNKLRNYQRKAAESRKYAHNEEVNRLRALGDTLLIEEMNIKALQKKAKEVTVHEKTGKFNRRKRFGKSIGKRSPGYFIQQAKFRFSITGGTVIQVNTWTFKASQFDHMLNSSNKKSLSQRWHTFPNKINVQRDLYSAFLLYCANEKREKPDINLCHSLFASFLVLHDQCVEEIKRNRKSVCNSGIKWNESIEQSALAIH